MDILSCNAPCNVVSISYMDIYIKMNKFNISPTVIIVFLTALLCTSCGSDSENTANDLVQTPTPETHYLKPQ